MSEAKSFRKHVLALLGETYGDKTLVLCPTVFVRLLGGDHKAAILLSQILYWSDKTKDPDGWFWKSYANWRTETGLSEAQVRRIVNGDSRVKGEQITLRDLGVETLLKKVKHTGAPTLHYRINQEAFLARLQALFEAGDSPQCAESNPSNVEDEVVPMLGMNPEQCGASSDPEIPTQIPDETSSESSDDDLHIFTFYEDRFGKRKDRLQGPFHDELARLGRERVGQVLERCATRGRSWNYVLKALANETGATMPSVSDPETRWDGSPALEGEEAQERPAAAESAPLRVSEHLELPWELPNQPGRTVQDMWAAATHQFEMQLSSDFRIWGRELTLVDFQTETATFVAVARSEAAREMLQQRLYRSLRRILGDVAGRPVELRFLVAEEWLGQGSPDEQIA